MAKNLKVVTLKPGVDENNMFVYTPHQGTYSAKRQVTHKIEKVFGRHSCNFGQIAQEFIETIVTYTLDIEGTDVDVTATLMCYPSEIFIKEIFTNADGNTHTFNPVRKAYNISRTREIVDKIVQNGYLNTGKLESKSSYYADECATEWTQSIQDVCKKVDPDLTLTHNPEGTKVERDKLMLLIEELSDADYKPTEEMRGFWNVSNPLNPEHGMSISFDRYICESSDYGIVLFY